MSPAKPIGRRSVERGTPITSIYDGRSCIGFVLARGRVGFEAFNAGDRSLGVFATRDAAINKLKDNGAAR
jgi:hypothetical protein